MKYKVLQLYGFDEKENSDRFGEVNNEPGLTQQHMREEADINTIVKRFGLGGSVPEGFRPPEFGDFSDVVDYQSALNAVRSAAQTFMELPAELRARFRNDPQEFMTFCHDPKNGDEMVTLGLRTPAPAAPGPVKVEVVATAGAGAPPSGAAPK